METLQTVLLVLQVLVAIALIGIILVQHGKGADAGAAFGSGASSTVFGAQGSGNFLTRTTSVLAFIFLVNSLALSYIASQRVRENHSLIQGSGSSGSIILNQKKQEQGKGKAPAQVPAKETQEKGKAGPNGETPAIPQG
jgi:preprotein translocase subunit SecG